MLPPALPTMMDKYESKSNVLVDVLFPYKRAQYKSSHSRPTAVQFGTKREKKKITKIRLEGRSISRRLM